MLRVLKIAFILIFIALISCVKKTELPKPNYGNYTPPINLADYCYFKTGSYWVYQDSASLKLDSVYVKNAYIQTYEVKPEDGKEYIGTFHHYYMKTVDGIGDEREYEIMMKMRHKVLNVVEDVIIAKYTGIGRLQHKLEFILDITYTCLTILITALLAVTEFQVHKEMSVGQEEVSILWQ